MTGSADDAGRPPAGGGSAVPTCYRHPGRETYIRCARCERPICPDCMQSAPVGFQCPQCVAEGRKGAREATTALGGARRQHGDILTKALIAINVAIWLFGLVWKSSSVSIYSIAAQQAHVNETAARLGLIRGRVDDGVTFGVVDGEWYRLVTAAFFHENVVHIGMNMVALWVLGSALEPVLGRWRFLALYLLSAVGGTAASLLTGSEATISFGASGAVFGLMGALFVVMRRLGRDTGAVVGILALNLVFGFVVSGIDWRAHLGGLVVGTALAAAFAYTPRQYRVVGSVVACLLAFGGVVLAVVLEVS